ncbi:hypothetical protein CRG98_020198 [Punica granatum]|uniref:Uncharacterized protein n=1 Tax=Punica granatum TaxID=22663 RepID=A0A2I0JSZ4_PUNGR|nr:hypothetical protein CRG98_020198 [Punica granatum]
MPAAPIRRNEVAGNSISHESHWGQGRARRGTKVTTRARLGRMGERARDVHGGAEQVGVWGLVGQPGGLVFEPWIQPKITVVPLSRIPTHLILSSSHL